MIKKIIAALLVLVLYAGIGYAQRGPYPGSGRAFTRDEMGEVTATGGSATAGYVAYIDNSDTLRTATWDTDSLNLYIVGVSTGGFKKLRTMGIVDTYSGACSTVGKWYWLGPAGLLLDSIPKLQNVRPVRVGKCIATDKLLLDILVMRREGDEE